GLRGIELYRGRPILYGLGSFAFDNELVTKQPAEFYQRYRLPPHEGGPADAYDARRAWRLQPGEDGVITEVDDASWLAAVALLCFDGDTLRSLQVHPLDLGYDLARARRGRPVMASGGMRTRTLEVLRELSREYGTHILDDGSIELQGGAL